MQLALVTHSAKVPDLELACIAEAVNLQVIECAQEWMLEPSPVVFYSTAHGLPSSNCRIVDIVDSIDVEGAAGYHSQDLGVVYARVLARSVDETSVTISHEALEMLVDPFVNQWRPMPDGLAVALEVCDPVQGDHYTTDVDIAGVRRRVMLSDYVLPTWFLAGSRGPVDKLGRISNPYEMSPGGYMICRDPDGSQSYRFARFGGDNARLAFANKFTAPDGRLSRRLAA